MSRYVVFGLLCLISAAVLWRSIAETLSLAINDDAYTHIILVVPICAALIVSEWSSLAYLVITNAKTGLSLFAFGILIVVLNDRHLAPGRDLRLAVNMLALVILWISAFIMCFGVRISRSLLFPLCFLFWMVPVPSSALVIIERWLQHESAIAAWMLFSATGVPAVRDGILVSIPGLTVEVAKECSSIRSSLMLLVTTMVLGHLLLKEFWRKTVLTLSAIPVSVAKNGLRIFTIAMLGTRVDRGFLTGHLHRDGGIVFFLFALLLTGILLGSLRKGETVTSKAIPVHPIADHIPGLVIDGSN
jgi:exosortase